MSYASWSSRKRALAFLAFVVPSTACGLSFGVGDPDPTGPVDGANDASGLPAPDRIDAPEASTAQDAEPSDSATPVDASTDASCTPILSETFATGAGLLTLLGNARVQNGRLEVLPDAPFDLGVQGAAYFTVPAGLSRFSVSFTLSTNALSTVYATADGFAFNWLEKAVPASPRLGGSNDLGMTLDPAPQHGHGLLFDIYPPVTEDRYVSDNELGPNTRYVREKLVSFKTTDATSFAFNIRVGGGFVDHQVTSSLGNANKRLPRGTAGTLYRTFFLSASAGAARSPGMFVDDLVISSCP